jgi:hypothetical protein
MASDLLTSVPSVSENVPSGFNLSAKSNLPDLLERILKSKDTGFVIEHFGASWFLVREICDGRSFAYRINGSWLYAEKTFLGILEREGSIVSRETRLEMDFKGMYLISLPNNCVFSF